MKARRRGRVGYRLRGAGYRYGFGEILGARGCGLPPGTPYPVPRYAARTRTRHPVPGTRQKRYLADLAAQTSSVRCPPRAKLPPERRGAKLDARLSRDRRGRRLYFYCGKTRKLRIAIAAARQQMNRAMSLEDKRNQRAALVAHHEVRFNTRATG